MLVGGVGVELNGEMSGTFAFAVCRPRMNLLFVILISHEKDGIRRWGEREGTHISSRPALGLLCAKAFVCKALAPSSSSNPLYG